MPCCSGLVMLARKAAERGLAPKPYVKTSLAPGSQVVTEYLRKADLLESLQAPPPHRGLVQAFGEDDERALEALLGRDDIAAMVAGLAEAYFALTDPEGRRIGDRYAGTKVIDENPGASAF